MISEEVREKYVKLYVDEAIQLFVLQIINGILFNNISFNQGMILIRHGLRYKYINTEGS